MITLFTDTDNDITPEIAAEYGYKLISMPYGFDGKSFLPYVDFERFDAHEFYEELRHGALPYTSAVTSEDYLKYFEPEFAAGRDILYVHFSRAISATFEAMDRAIELLEMRYPYRKFYKIDTKSISAGGLNIVLEIGDMFKAGKSIEEILAWAKEEVDRYAVYFFADDLKFFSRSGRVSGLTGVMGSILGYRPIIHINTEGQMVSIGKEKGRNNAMNRLMSYVEELGDDFYNHRVVISHSDAPQIVDKLVTMLREKHGEKLNILVVEVNPTAGCHCGPDAVGIAFHAKHR